MSKHFITSDGIKIDGFDSATAFNKALKEWQEKENLKASIVKQEPYKWVNLMEREQTNEK